MNVLIVESLGWTRVTIDQSAKAAAQRFTQMDRNCQGRLEG